MKKEKWKLILGHEKYSISTWGRVYSNEAQNFLRAYVHKSRSNYYLRVCLDNNKKYMVHVLVARAFKTPKCEKSGEVNHLDRNTLNCNENNLEWCTSSQNKLHRFKTDVK